MKVIAAAPIDPNYCGARRGYKVNLSAIVLLIRFFDPELKKIPAGSVSCCAGKVSTKL